MCSNFYCDDFWFSQQCTKMHNIGISLKPNFMSSFFVKSGISLNMHFPQSLLKFKRYLLIYIWSKMLPSSLDTL